MPPGAPEATDELAAMSLPDNHAFSDFVLREKSRACKLEFRKCLNVDNLPHEDWLEQRSAEFNWWTSGLNADKNGPGSLDARLRLRPDVTAVIVDALDGLHDALSTYHELATSDPPISDEEGPPDFKEGDLESTASDGAQRAPSPWSDMSSGSEWNQTSSVGNGEYEDEETGDAESQREEVDSPSSTDIYAEQRVYIENNLEVLIRIHTAIKRSGLKFRNKRADDGLSQSEQEFERQKLTLGAHRALAGPDGEHERFRRYLAKLVLRNGYTENLISRLNFSIYELVATERPQDAMELRDSQHSQDQERSEIAGRSVHGQTKESHAVLLQTKIMIVLRAYFYDPARLTTVQRRLIDANIVRRNRMTHAGKASKAPSHVRDENSTIISVTKSPTPQRTSLMASNITPSSSNLLPSPASRPVTQSKQGSQVTKSFVAQPATALESNFSITGALKPSIRSTARSAGTKMSARVGHLDYPSCPAKEDSDGPFPCEYCPMILPQEYKKKERWRGHVAKDLCGYVCVFEDCRSPEDMFASTYEWMSHMARFHSEFEWVCPLCAKNRLPHDADDAQEASFPDPSQLKDHILAIHPAADAAADPDEVDLVASAGQRTVGIRKVRCPLCRPGLVTSEEDIDDYAVCPRPVGEEVGLVQLEEDQHIATHIHEFALHAFPSLDGEELSEQARESVSSQASTRVSIKLEGPQLAEDLPQGREFTYTLDEIRDLIDNLRSTFRTLQDLGSRTSISVRIHAMRRNITYLDDTIQLAQEKVDLVGFARGLGEAIALASSLLDILPASDGDSPHIIKVADELEESFLELLSLLDAGRQIGQLGTGSPDAPPAKSLGDFSPASPGDAFYLPKPEDRLIDDMFLQLMQKRGWQNLPDQAQRQMLAYPSAKKWTLVHQDRLSEWQSEQKRGATPWQIIHRVQCHATPGEHTYYLDSPWMVESGPFDSHLRGAEPIGNLELFLERSKEILFMVYRDYTCCAKRLTSTLQVQDKSSQERVALSLLCSENISIISPELHTGLVRVAEVALRGISDSLNFQGQYEIHYPYIDFFHRRKEIWDEFDKQPHLARLHLSQLRDYIQSRMMAEWFAVNKLLITQRISAQYMQYLIVRFPSTANKGLVPGQIIISREKGSALAQTTAFVAQGWLHVVRGSSDGIEAILVPACTWTFDGRFHKKHMRLRIATEDFPSTTDPFDIIGLPFYPIEFASEGLNEALRERGHQFWRCRGKRYVSLDTEMDDDRQTAPNSRFMIDMGLYKRLHPSDEPDHNSDQAEGDELAEEYMSQDDPPLGDEFFMCLPPSIPGFDMQRKKWVSLDVHLIREVQWNTGAFDSLFIDPNQKSILLSLFESHQHRVSKDMDRIDRKGKGLMIRLLGVPGTGKTLTAESLAEATQMPLYRISGKDIGTKAEDAALNLKVAFTLGKEWDCVVLIDEADDLLEERSSLNLERSAVVSVFLKMLEDYDGILILTSNDYLTIDDAFQSRIHVSFRMKTPERDQRAQIWKHLLRQARIFDENGRENNNNIAEGVELDINIGNVLDHIEDLAAVELNGRQIKNLISTARQFGAYCHEPLGYKHLSLVLRNSKSEGLDESWYHEFDHDLVEKFTRYLIDLKNKEGLGDGRPDQSRGTNLRDRSSIFGGSKFQF